MASSDAPAQPKTLTRQRIEAKRQPDVSVAAPGSKRRMQVEPNIMQRLASRETCGTTSMRKFTHAKPFLDMKLNVRTINFRRAGASNWLRFFATGRV